MYSRPLVMPKVCKIQGCQCYKVKRINSHICKIRAIVEKGSGNLFITPNSFYFFNKTDFEQFFVEVKNNKTYF